MRTLLLPLLLSWLGTPGSEAFLDNLRQSLSQAQEYLADVAPYIAQGLKTVQRVEQFLDSAIAEDCPYACPTGQKAVDRAGHVKTSNGCGAMDMFFDDSETSWIKLEKAFTVCCNEHDECYDTCGQDKDWCDLRFKKCLYRVCQRDQYALMGQKACQLKAKLAFLAVMGVGCQMYKDAQSQACRCVPDVFQREEL